MIQLKTEAGSHRTGQIPTYFELGRHHFPTHRIDLTYLTGPLQKKPSVVPDGLRFCHLTWEEVFPLVAETWTESHHDHVAAIGAVLADLGSPWTSWRAQRLSTPDLADASQVAGDPVSVGITIARETALDHRQRAVDVRVVDLEALQRARVDLRDALLDDPHLESVKPWIWRTASGGRPLTSNGAEVGYELRLSW